MSSSSNNHEGDDIEELQNLISENQKIHYFFKTFAQQSIADETWDTMKELLKIKDELQKNIHVLFFKTYPIDNSNFIKNLTIEKIDLFLSSEEKKWSTGMNISVMKLHVRRQR